MSYIQALILGVVQGLTEFIPVSSSAHLNLVPEILNWNTQPTSFDIVLHAGTLLALIIFFRRKFIKFSKSLLDNGEEKKTTIKIITASVPAIIIAGIVTVLDNVNNGAIDNFLKDIRLEIFFLIFVGILLIASDFLYKKNNKVLRDLTYKESQIIGFSQAMALLRGVSRSGITIFFGMFNGLRREEAAEFSFLIGIPVISLGFIFQLYEFINEGLGELQIGVLVVGFITSFISGYLAIRFLLAFVKNHGLAIFGIYRILISIVVIFVLFL